jgi:hypothetical protein
MRRKAADTVFQPTGPGLPATVLFWAIVIGTSDESIKENPRGSPACLAG